MKTLLLTGASGFLGYQFCQHPQSDWNIIGTYHKNPKGIFPGTKAIPLNLLDSTAIESIIQKVKPDAVLHLAANSSTGFCEKHPAQSYKINVIASANLAEICTKQNIHLVFTSSEQVYNGAKKTYTDSDEANPINTYGKQKAEAEKQILKIRPTAAIARIAVLFGNQENSAYCFMNDWLGKWSRGEEVTAFHDEVRSFLSARSAVEALLLLLNKKEKGIFNIGGADAMSRYAFAQLLAENFGYENARIKSLSRLDIIGGEKRPASLVLDNIRITDLGFEPKSIAEELDSLR
ncbi:MAG: NAD(P)-dependent oxidoreductase [Saprospiraceae bacterium]